MSAYKGTTGSRSQSILSLLYPPNPWCQWSDMLCEVWPHHWDLGPLLFSNSVVGFFTSHKNQIIMLTAVRGNVQFFVLIQEDCRKSNYKILQMSLQRPHFLLNYLKDPECCSGWGLNPWPSTQQTCALST